MKLNEFYDVVFQCHPVRVEQDHRVKIMENYEFLERFSKDKIVYGINTGFGPMAQCRVDDKDLKQLQYNIIRSHACGAGEPLPELYVRAAMLCRLATFLQCRSGVHPETADLIAQFINNGIYPVVPRHGGVGASGDLVQLAHIALTLIGEGEVYYKGAIRPAAEALEECGIKPLGIHIREGLALTNGTSVMTGIGLVNLVRARKLLEWSVAASVMINEIASSYGDFMSEELNNAKQHEGQRRIAEIMRGLCEGSKCIAEREVELYNGKNHEKIFTKKVQSYYSLRCTPQILGPVLDELDNAQKVLLDELNSVDDNPIVDSQAQNIYHGGNFHGDYVSFEMDKLKIAITKLTMLTERQLNYLCHDRINGILPPFLNLGVLGLNYGLQAAQFTATSTTAESQTLSNPMYVHSIPSNNDNQDVVSMGTNSALIAATVIENGYQVMAIQLMALAQAVDYLAIEDRMAARSHDIYRKVRQIVPTFVEDTPKYKEIAALVDFLKNEDLNIIT